MKLITIKYNNNNYESLFLKRIVIVNDSLRVSWGHQLSDAQMPILSRPMGFPRQEPKMKITEVQSTQKESRYVLCPSLE